MKRKSAKNKDKLLKIIKNSYDKDNPNDDRTKKESRRNTRRNKNKSKSTKFNKNNIKRTIILAKIFYTIFIIYLSF